MPNTVAKTIKKKDQNVEKKLLGQTDNRFL